MQQLYQFFDNILAEVKESDYYKAKKLQNEAYGAMRFVRFFSQQQDRETVSQAYFKFLEYSNKVLCEIEETND